MNESLVKYLAGLLDADGSLSFNFKHDQNRPGRYFIGLNLHLTASDAVDRNGFVGSLPQLTGMGSTHRYGERKQFLVWSVGKRADLERLLPRLTKHMVIKAKHWQWMLDTWRALRQNSNTVSEGERERLSAASKESRNTRVGPLKPKNHPTWAWLAGYLDGDGWYRYQKTYAKTIGHWQWSMSMGAVAHINDVSVLEFLQRAFGGIIRDHSKDNDRLKIWYRSLGYQNRSFALNFLPNVAKHSRLKRNKIQAIIHHHQQRLSVPGMPRNYCEVDNCGRPATGHKMCSMHYQRWKRRKNSKHVSDSLKRQASL